ncbi:MAG: hybrid sensor histidine kinase/response regulator, partial [Caldimonas sp.]
IDLRYTGSERPIIVFGDVVRVEQIVWNLLSNAIKFTAAGGVIAVRLFEQGGEAVLEVADNGRGISPRFLPSVFDMFRQEEGYRTRREGGLGLGLGLVRELVQMQGGTVRAESPGAGRGATFTVRLPIHARSDFAALDTPPDDEQPLAGLRILLVDDSADALETFAMVLSAEGAIVTCAASASAALSCCKEASFDLIVSDIGMPEMDGTQLIALLRREPSTATTPAIALTGYGRPQDIEASMAAGFTAHLLKPVDLANFRRVARRLVPKT